MNLSVVGLPPENSLYRQILGEDFENLPSPIRELHSHQGTVYYVGEAAVLGPQTWLARILAALLGTPQRASSGPIKFELTAAHNQERWTRHFSTGTMTSTMKNTNGRLTEKLRMATLYFGLVVVDQRLQMKLLKMVFCGIACPAWLMPRIVAEETVQNGRICFKVEAHVAFAGRVVGYQGFLQLMGIESPT